MLDKLARYGQKVGIPVFLMFGGGEPTLRTDLPEILSHAANLFGSDQVGFCTNGTFRDIESVLSCADTVGMLEVSIDGPEAYHNAWRTPGAAGEAFNAYGRAMALVEAAVEACPEKLEVASMVTRENLALLPSFARHLRRMGVREYSIHRPIPVGRMARQLGQVPTVGDYYQLLAAMAAVAVEDETFLLHVHHSLESIYSALLLGVDLHRSGLPMGSRRHSIGIAWDGSVHFDPWSHPLPIKLRVELHFVLYR